MKTKVMTIVGTRPEIIKLSRVIHELDKFTDHILVHTGQNYDYELNEIFFNDLEIRKPNHFLNAVGNSHDPSLVTSSGNVLEEDSLISPYILFPEIFFYPIHHIFLILFFFRQIINQI